MELKDQLMLLKDQLTLLRNQFMVLHTKCQLMVLHTKCQLMVPHMVFKNQFTIEFINKPHTNKSHINHINLKFTRNNTKLLSTQRDTNRKKLFW